MATVCVKKSSGAVQGRPVLIAEHKNMDDHRPAAGLLYDFAGNSSPGNGDLMRACSSGRARKNSQSSWPESSACARKGGVVSVVIRKPLKSGVCEMEIRPGQGGFFRSNGALEVGLDQSPIVLVELRKKEKPDPAVI